VSYTRHTSRSLMLWLLTLPFALWDGMGWAAVPAVALMSYLMLGIDEIGVQIEEPFGVLPVKVRSIHWSPYDPVRVVNADP